MASISCDIVLLPTPELATKALNQSKQLERYGTLFTLDDTKFFAHASLYMVQLKEEDLSQVSALLAEIAASTAPIEAVSARYDQAEGFIDVDYERSVTLDDLQMRVVQAINPIRDGLRENDKPRLLTTTGPVLANLQ